MKKYKRKRIKVHLLKQPQCLTPGRLNNTTIQAQSDKTLIKPLLCTGVESQMRIQCRAIAAQQIPVPKIPSTSPCMPLDGLSVFISHVARVALL